MPSFDLKSLIYKKIREQGYEKFRETLDETLDEILPQESHKESHEIQPQFDRIRQENSLAVAPRFSWPKDVFNGVPEDASVRFPSIRHEPDLRGFGVPSHTLPDELQIFGYWGYNLCLSRASRMLQIITTPRSASCRAHVVHWLHWRYDEVMAAFRQWDEHHKLLFGNGVK